MPANPNERAAVSLSQTDWGLHRQGPVDEARHREKVKEAIKDNLADIISQEAVITQDGKKIVRVPVRSLDLPNFQFGNNKGKHVGQGDGHSQIGDVLGRTDGKGQRSDKKAGDKPGIDYYEADVTIDELMEMAFRDFSLPHLKQKQSRDLEASTVRYSDIRRSGPMSNLAKKQTIMENLKRNAMTGGKATFGGIKNEDLRFKTWSSDVRRDVNAAVIAMRDVSGSMGEFEKYVSRTFYAWMVRFLRQKYQDVQITFITHHTEAKEVDEQTFFNLGESGGTVVSSAYQKALDIIGTRYNPANWNIYPFHFSDGDNWSDTDNKLCVELVDKLIDVSNVFGYGEIRQHTSNYQPSTLMSFYEQNIQNPRFVGVTITDRQGVYPALKQFFTARGEDVEGTGERRI